MGDLATSGHCSPATPSSEISLPCAGSFWVEIFYKEKKSPKKKKKGEVKQLNSKCPMGVLPKPCWDCR